jgi:hypothetical protein
VRVLVVRVALENAVAVPDGSLRVAAGGGQVGKGTGDRNVRCRASSRRGAAQSS